ncbi:MarR family winged helix-turn-helix transcriptional regulator [Tateyamaria sp. SN3-11]|uniref:MarR family winged helix-turn-helix transcriptional regulator n=1 Tax=Tateyamaria sp. SN3-11 TaxID=3092147 RepID=UPI0039E7C76F
MRRIHSGVHAKAHVFDTERVGPGGGFVLLTIAEMGCPELHELTKRVARDKSQMTRTIRTLESKGLVARKTASHDARVTVVFLTDAGQDAVRAIQHAVAETIGEILAPISESDADLLKSLLHRALAGASTA